MLVFEFCAENLTYIDKAIAAGAGRIELCDNLAVGGTTPSIGVINEAIKLTRAKSVDLCVIIRPRGGDFVYTELEVEAMLADIRAAKERNRGYLFCAGCADERSKVGPEDHAAFTSSLWRGRGGLSYGL